MFAGMKMILTPESDSDNSWVSEESSGVSFTRTQNNEGTCTVSVTMTLTGGRVLTFDADELGATMRAMGVL